MEKRIWCYVQQPAHFDIPSCSCGTPSQWSEYKKHLWCEKCQKDFIPEHGGVFDGPVGLEMSKILGYDFTTYKIRKVANS